MGGPTTRRRAPNIRSPSHEVGQMRWLMVGISRTHGRYVRASHHFRTPFVTDALVVFGGSDSATGAPLRDAWIYDLNTLGRWTKVRRALVLWSIAPLPGPDCSTRLLILNAPMRIHATPTGAQQRPMVCARKALLPHGCCDDAARRRRRTGAYCGWAGGGPSGR